MASQIMNREFFRYKSSKSLTLGDIHLLNTTNGGTKKYGRD